MPPLGLPWPSSWRPAQPTAHERGDIILRLGLEGTALNDDPYRRDASWQTLTGASSNPDFSLKLKDDLAPSVGATWMVADAFGVNLSWRSWHHNLRGRYRGTNPAWGDYNGLNMARFQHDTLDVGAVWYPLGAGAARLHPYVGLSTTYSRVKSQIHRHWSALEHSYIDEDLANGLISSAQAAAEHQQWDADVADSRVRDMAAERAAGLCPGVWQPDVLELDPGRWFQVLRAPRWRVGGFGGH